MKNLSYEAIFKRLRKKPTFIALEYRRPIQDILKKNPLFQQFVTDKVYLHKELEEKYKDKCPISKQDSFNLFLSSVCSEDILMHHSGYEAFADEVKEIVDNFFQDNYPDIEKQMFDYINENTDLVSSLLKGLHAENKLFKIVLRNLYFLDDFDINLLVYLHVDDALINDLINIVKYDNPDLCFGYDNPEIYSNFEGIFFGLTDEEFYEWR